MKRIRFTIGNLLILVLFLGISFGALRDANDIWDSATFTLTVSLLLLAILLAIHRADRARAFWLGFVVVGGAYLVLRLVPSIHDRLLTSRALAYVDSRLPGRPVFVQIAQSGTSNAAPDTLLVQNVRIAAAAFSPGSGSADIVGVWNAAKGNLLGVIRSTNAHFIRIGHSLIALVVGWLAGCLSRHLDVRSRLAAEVQAEPSESRSPAAA